MSTYERLMDLLDSRGAEYRLIHHTPAMPSRWREHQLSRTARCVVVRIKRARTPDRHVLAVVPGDQQVALDVLREMWHGTHVSYVTTKTAEALTGCASGATIPFALRTGLVLVVDQNLLAEHEIVFRAARQDVSVALNTADYLRLAVPRVADITLAPLTEAA